jgi:antitoxin HicB
MEIALSMKRERFAMSQFSYTIILEPDPDEGGYTVTVPTLPGCVTQGETLEEAIAMAKDAIRLYIETLLAEGEPIPQEHEHPQAIIVNIAA